MSKKEENPLYQGLKTFNLNRKYHKWISFFCFFFTILLIFLGIQFANNSISNFLISIAIGITSGYLTGAIATYFSDKQTEGLMDIDYKISELDTYIKECDLEVNEFSYNSEDAPMKISLYSFPQGERYGFTILLRMAAVFTNISKCEFHDFSNIEVSVYWDDDKVEAVPIANFYNKINEHLTETLEDGQLPFTNVQINNMLMNVLNVKFSLNKAKDALIAEKKSIFFNEK